jgi:hypothetical protein
MTDVPPSIVLPMAVKHLINKSGNFDRFTAWRPELLDYAELGRLVEI